MERLTRGINGVVVYIGVKNSYSTGQIPCEVEPAGVREMMDRLAAYEDTERTPEEIDKDHEAAEQLRHLCRNCDLDRLEKLAEADKDGRVAVLPCKANGAMLNTSYPDKPQLMERVHFAVAYVSSGIVFHQPYNIFLENIAAGYIKPVSEEAEKALEAMEDE